MRRTILAPGSPLLLLMGFLLLGLPSARLAAQTVPTLEQVDGLIRDGRAGPARAALLGWWDREWDAAPRPDRERALWQRGTLTLEPSEASSSYRRIVTEFPGGRFADQALLRLGFITALRGDTVSAARWFEALERDHPTSPERDRAREWLDLPGVRSALAREAPSPRVDRPPAPSGIHAVQLGAFSSRGRAETLARQVRDRGFDVRVVRVTGDPLWRVRAGRFEDETAARALRGRLAEADLDVVLVTDADREVDGGEADRTR